MPEILVAAGSNIEPQCRLQQALAAARREFGTLKVSLAYRNAAVGFDGDDFVNLVFAFTSDAQVKEVLAGLHAIESECGRERNEPKWAPRAMDLDVLLFGDLVCDEPGLKLPRPDLVRRPYMLRPAAELAPEFVHPTLKQTLADLWRAFDSDGHEMTPIAL